MATVTINGDTYDAFVTVAEVDSYANASTTGETWLALSDDDKGRAIVTATRWIMGECWKDPQPDPTAPVEPFISANILLALALASDPEIYNTLSGATVSTDGGTKRLKAGSVEIEYFRKLNFGVFGSSVSPFPGNVMSLVRESMCNSGASWGNAGSSSWGTCTDSKVGRTGKYGFIEPF